ncbi:hypothetical protein NC651_006995 [Populus alba x Populus x berolinensis]|nr:hypothetical protein NC651_006995 [Populus alba x Populus x berolinensis]
MEGGVEDVGTSAGLRSAATGGGEERWLLGAAVVVLRSTTGTDKVKQLSAGPRCCQSRDQQRWTAHGVAQEKMKCWWRSRCCFHGGMEVSREGLLIMLILFGLLRFFLLIIS